MINSLQVALALLVSGVLLVGPAHAGGDKAKGPEDVFEAFAAAMKKEDVKAVMSHLTRDSQTVLTVHMILQAVVSEIFAKSDEKKAIDEVLKRHGLSADAVWKKLEDSKELKDDGILVALGETVKDKPAFVAETSIKVTGRLDKDSGSWATLPANSSEWFKQIGGASIKDVKIDGEQAKGQVTIPGADGKERAGTLYFKLESGVWKIDLIETDQHWPRPPRPPQAQPPGTHYDSRPGLLRRLFSRLRGR